MHLHFDWGLAGAREAGNAGAEFAVVVDVLSFTTTVSVAADQGIDVWPYKWRDNGAEAFARSIGAELAVPRSDSDTRRLTLSAQSILNANPLPRRLVLPSPNGSAIVAALPGLPCVAVSLRNVTAVATWMNENLDGHGVVVAAGELRRDGSLRPCLEDAIGAGALLSSVDAELTSEAEWCAASYLGCSRDVERLVRGSISGKELSDKGFEDDVDVAIEMGASNSVPVLIDGRFHDAGRTV